MPMIFFVSSVGDTDLAKETINRLVEAKSEEQIFVVPVTSTAKIQIQNLIKSPLVHPISLSDIVKSEEWEGPDILSRKEITPAELKKLSGFIKTKEIRCAYIGVPSPLNEEIPFQIALSLRALGLSCTLAYEFMFNAPQSHAFWRYLDKCVEADCEFAVALPDAKTDIQGKNRKAKVLPPIGHLSLDRALVEAKLDAASIRTSLSINEDNEFIFVSGTTQPTEVDTAFLEALLKEMSTGKYPHIQLRFGIHPGVGDKIKDYLEALLKVCKKYPGTQKQFQIILPDVLKNKLGPRFLLDLPPPLPAFILESNVPGPQAAQIAARVAQAVPGALLNENAFKGKPVYSHEKSVTSYLTPKKLKGSLFSNSIEMFFTDKPRPPLSKENLEIKETAPDNMMSILMRGKA